MWDHPNRGGMISISLKGTTRRPVIVIGTWALKFSRGERGRRCNLYEAKLCRNSSELRRAMLCPVRWCSRKGLLLVMQSAISRDISSLPMLFPIRFSGKIWLGELKLSY